MKETLIISNWKLNGNKHTLIKYFNTLNNKINQTSSKFKIIIAPPIVYLDTVKNLINNHIQLCAQNVDIHLSGSFTGEISSLMLKDLGVRYVLIGHSERRIYHSENDSYIAKKFSILKKNELIPILCIGENKTEHDAGSTLEVCIKQLNPIIKLLGVQSFKKSIIAYEPIWAIGSGIPADPANIQFIHKSIRNHIAQYDLSIANQLSIQYGGSVNITNIKKIIRQKDIDGVLIGTASLDVENFYSIIQSIEEYQKTQSPPKLNHINHNL